MRGLHGHRARYERCYCRRENGYRSHRRERRLSPENDAVDTQLGASRRHLAHYWAANDGELLTEQRVGVQRRCAVFCLCHAVVTNHRSTCLDHLFFSYFPSLS